MWWCECVCGNVRPIQIVYVINGNTKSCGCYASERTRQRSTTHGEKQGGKETVEYRAWRGAQYRCNNPNNKNFKNYGGRGIEFRLTSVTDILDTIGRRPTAKHSLDRIDNDGNYEEGNIRWATRKQQANNRRKWLLT